MSMDSVIPDEPQSTPEPGGQEPSPGTEPSQPSPPAPLSEYDQKIMGGGEDALNEVKNWQRKFNSLKDKVGDSLRTTIESHGGEQVYQWLQQYDNILANDEIKTIVSNYLKTGKVEGLPRQDPGSATDYINPYADPEPPENGELTRLRQDVLEMRASVAKQGLQGHFQRAMSEWPVTGELRDKVISGVRKTLDDWSKDELGVKAIQNLDYRSTRNLILSQLDDGEFDQVMSARANRRDTTRQGMATDAPRTGALTARQPVDAGENRSIGDVAKAAFEEACAMERTDPWRLDIQS